MDVCGGRKGHILVVDSEQVLLDVMDSLLAQEGYQVSTASCARAAFKILAKEQVDVVVTTIEMTGMSGLKMAELISLEFPGPAIIVCTNHGSITVLEAASRLPISDLIRKPFKVEYFLKSIRLAAAIGPEWNSDFIQAIRYKKLPEFVEAVLAECHGDDEEAARRYSIHPFPLEKPKA